MTGHYAAGTADRETGRSAAMGKLQSQAEMTWPLASGREVTECAWPVIDATFRFSIDKIEGGAAG